ncbi:hypothetical protein CERSUDRAFT_101677, partial [Gelatoporia subvermispora B]
PSALVSSPAPPPRPGLIRPEEGPPALPILLRLLFQHDRQRTVASPITVLPPTTPRALSLIALSALSPRCLRGTYS